MDRRILTVSTLAAALALAAATPSAWAQTVGTFRWQLQPYCNVVTVTITGVGGVYTLDGTDDQCATTGPYAAVTGTAFQNPDGQIGFGMHIVATPGALPVDVDAAIALPSLGGTWRDSSGNQGTFAFTPGAGTGGNPRPATGLGRAAVNPAQVQLRITGSCSNGQLMTGVSATGGVICQSVSGANGGDITSVTAGPGLTGGGTTGDVGLSVSFAGRGNATTAARSDHDHAGPGLVSNTAAGGSALSAFQSGGGNTAFGFASATRLTSGLYDTAIGTNALFSSTNSNHNSAIGAFALAVHTVGDDNSAIGYTALESLDLGANNTAIGNQAGKNLQNGSNNLYIANEGVTSEGNTIRLGSGLWHTRMFLAGTRNVTTGQNNGVPVLIDAQGQLGTINSSRRTKEAIEDLPALSDRLMRLRPTQFRYIAPFADGTKPVQYGLIAEEVEEVLPELVAYGLDGQPDTVKYHVLPTLLLAEVQRLERERAATAARLDTAMRELDALRATVESLKTSAAESRPGGGPR